MMMDIESNYSFYSSNFSIGILGLHWISIMVPRNGFVLCAH
jgi:hypothetical protein